MTVGIATGWKAGVHFLAGARVFLVSRPTLGPTQPPIQWVPRGPSQGVKWLRREDDHLPPSSAEVKNCGAIPPLPIHFISFIY
jgi:hypothetical protein